MALALALLPGCDRGADVPAGPPAAGTDAPAPSSEETPGTGSASIEEAPSGEAEGSGSPAIGNPTGDRATPEGWPPQVPHPPGAVIERRTAEGQAQLMLTGVHPADHEDLLQWFASHMADEGWLVLQRDRLGSSSRVRLARDRERWLVVVGARESEEGGLETWFNLHQQLNEPPIASSPGLAGAWDCAAALPRTPDKPPAWCELHVGRTFEAPLRQLGEQDAAVAGEEIAFVAVAGDELQILTLRDGEVDQPPTTLVHAGGSAPLAAPQVVAGERGGWLVSWISGDPPERAVVLLDRRLRPIDEQRVMSRELGRVSDAAWAPIDGEGGDDAEEAGDLAAAWIERSDELHAFRIASVERGSGRTRRSGRLVVRGAEPLVGPALVHDGRRSLGLVWGSADGVMFRSVGTDGLPDQPERRLEPGRPTWVGAAYGDDSFWTVWATPRSGFWVRANVEGCADNARGSLGGIPDHVWTSTLGAIVQVRDAGVVRLVRLADRGGDDPDRSPEVVGTSHLRVDWSDLEPVGAGFRGVAHTDAGFATAEWVCEPMARGE